jgi:hypothetical protein
VLSGLRFLRFVLSVSIALFLGVSFSHVDLLACGLSCSLSARIPDPFHFPCSCSQFRVIMFVFRVHHPRSTEKRRMVGPAGTTPSPQTPGPRGHSEPPRHRALKWGAGGRGEAVRYNINQIASPKFPKLNNNSEQV